MAMLKAEVEGSSWNYPPSLPAGTTGKQGLHLSPEKELNFTHTLTDGGGYRWDLNNGGGVGNGTSNVFSNGMYCQVDNSSIRANYAWSAGDERAIELADLHSDPRYGRQRQGVMVYRRIRVYEDLPLARWLEIFQNSSNEPRVVQVRVHSSFSYGIGSVATSNGDGEIDEDDTWVQVSPRRSAPSEVPSVVTVFCDDRAASRPRVSKSSSSFYLHYTLKIPPGGTAILCHFQSQIGSDQERQKLLRSLRPYRLLDDLHPTVRKQIVNFGRVSGYGNVYLHRTPEADYLELRNGDPLFGRLVREQYTLASRLGPETASAEELVGMARDPDQPERLLALLADGQIVQVRAPEET
ncbi:MAG: hypothetical protein ACOC93_02645, partial [Planctomycetota bacterium]